MKTIRKPIAFIAAVAMALTSVIVLNPPAARACSCAFVDPVDAVGTADVVFTGMATSNSGDEFAPVWQFDIDGVIKGQVSSQETVVGEDWAAGCGRDFGQFRDAIVVYADRSDNQLRARGCMPTPTVQEFTDLLDEIQEPTGTGPPAAIMSGVYQASDFAILDEHGRTLARTTLGTDASAVAHCPGTTTAAVVANFPEPMLMLVDLSTLDIIGQQRFDHEFLHVNGDRVTCLDGGATVVASAGYGPNTGSVEVSSISTRAGVTTTEHGSFRVGRAIVHPGGTVFLLPTRVGDPLETLTAESLKRIVGSAVTLPAGASIINGDVSPDGSRLALLATLTGDDASYDTGATHVLVLDVVDAIPVADSASVVPLISAGPSIETPQGAAQMIQWIDDSTWIIESETATSKRIRIVADDGTHELNNVEVAWGWGLTPLPSGILRSTNGGVEVLARSGSTEPGDPAPGSEFSDRVLWTAPLIDAPEFTPVAPPASVLAITPVVTTVSETDEPGGTVADVSSSRDLGWLVPVLGGLAFLAAAAVWFRSAPGRKKVASPPQRSNSHKFQ